MCLRHVKNSKGIDDVSPLRALSVRCMHARTFSEESLPPETINSDFRKIAAISDKNFTDSSSSEYFLIMTSIDLLFD